MDLSLGFLTKVIDDDRLKQAEREGITQHFLDDDYVPVFSYIQRHYTEYKKTPSRDAVLKAFPNFNFSEYKEPIEYFIAELKDSYRRSVLDEKLHHIAGVYQRDTSKAETFLREALSELQITSKSFKDVNVTETTEERFEWYLDRKQNPGVDGVPSNWPKLDYQTLGWHPEEFIVLVGEKYMGKTWAMLWLAYQALQHGERVLFLTKEMSQDAITRRFDSIYASVKFDSLRRGELSNVEENRYQEKLAELSRSSAHFTIARQGVNTIDDIERKAVETDSTIVFADSVYLFLPDTNTTYNGPVATRLAISQKCKSIAQRLQVPFVVSVQAGRKKSKGQQPDIDDIEWSNAFSQDADTVLYIHKDELDRELRRQQVWLLKSRDGDLTDFFVDQDFEYMRFNARDDESRPKTTIEFDEEDKEDVLDFT